MQKYNKYKNRKNVTKFVFAHMHARNNADLAVRVLKGIAQWELQEIQEFVN